MREPVDILIDAAVDAVATSGAIESVARMATVSAVGTGPAAGTVDVALDEGTVPRVRLLSGYYAPVVGDLVEVMKTSAGWVCLGRLLPSVPAGTVVDMRAGSVTVTTGTNNIGSATVTFPALRGDTFVGSATVNSGSLQLVGGPPGVASITATSAVVYGRRTASGVDLNLFWTIFGVKG